MSKAILKMKFRTMALALGLAALPFHVDAAGLGRITVLSTIGQPLRAEVDVNASREEIGSLSARVAASDVFKQSGVEYASILTNVRFTVEKRSDGQPYLLMRSDLPFNEPFLDLLLELSWASGRMVREYTFLLDPPDSLKKVDEQVAQVAPVMLPTARVEDSSKFTSSASAEVGDEEKGATRKKPGSDMRVTRDRDGVQRIVRTEPISVKDETGAVTRIVKRGGTLHRIAVETRPDDVSLDQMLVALFRNNQNAFDGGNINRLRSGQILTIPNRDSVMAIDAAEAKQIVLTHFSDFNTYRKRLAETARVAVVQKDESPSSQAAVGKIVKKVEEKPPAGGVATSQGKLEISRSEGVSAQTATGRRAAAEEERLAREKATQEANARIANLDKNISDLKKLAEIKNQSVGDAKKLPQPPAVKAPDLDIPSNPAPVQAVSAASVPPVETTPALAPAPDVAAVSTAVPDQVPAAAPVPPVAKEKIAPQPEPPAPPPSFVDDNPEIVFGGSGVLALLAGYLGFSFWRKRRKAKEAGAGGVDNPTIPSINSVFGSTGGQVVDTGNSTASLLQTDFSLAEIGANDSAEGVDPIKEADVYMAYGRNAQAEEILLDALKSDPERQAIHLKLLEIYAARKSAKQFEAIALDLQKLSGSTGSNWERAQQLGQEIDPDNPLYSGGGDAAYDPAATMIMTPQDMNGLADSSQSEVVADSARMDKTLVIQPDVVVASAPAVAEDFPDSLDFELDLGSPVAGVGAETAMLRAGDIAVPGEPESADLGFDLDLGGDVAKSAESSGPSNEIDFDLDGGAPVLSLESPQEVAVDAPNLDANMIDFDLPGLAPVAPERQQQGSLSSGNELPVHETSAMSAMALDMPNIDLPDVAPLPEVAPMLSMDLSSINLDLDSGVKAEPTSTTTQATADDKSGSPEVETKLELAQAYEEMGDKDGARELLQEALNEGNARQQDIARSKLEKLG